MTTPTPQPCPVCHRPLHLPHADFSHGEGDGAMVLHGEIQTPDWQNTTAVALHLYVPFYGRYQVWPARLITTFPETAAAL